jgi:hypothetical protein
MNFLQRLCNFYQQSHSDPTKLSHIWIGMINFHKPLIDALESGDTVAVQKFFRDPGDAFYGLDSKIMQFWGNAITTDYFAGLARRIGAVPVRHPLNPSPDENWNPKDGIELRKQIEAITGPIVVPNG